jgi:uncharacterized membrane protein YhaH (DUF805 family)
MDNIDWADLLFKFDGRINRGKFWLGMVVIGVVPWGVMMLGFIIDAGIFLWLASVLYLVVIWPWLAVSIKRWHDRGKSGWWVFIAWVPFIGWLWALVETGFLPGDPGTNRYGPDPLANL